MKLLLALLAFTGVAADVSYERDIKPVLTERCYSCHSRLKQKGKLRLDAGALIHKGGSDGSAVIAGKSGASWRRFSRKPRSSSKDAPQTAG